MNKRLTLKILTVIPAISMSMLSAVGCGKKTTETVVHVNTVEIIHFKTENKTDYYDKDQPFNYGYVGKQKQLKANVTPENATNKSLTWKVLDGSIASIDQNGNVIPKEQGLTEIEVFSVDGQKHHKIWFAVINETTEPTGVEFISKLPDTIHQNEEYPIQASVLPVNAAQFVTFSSSNSTVATVERSDEEYNKAKIKTLAAGETTITAETYNGKTTNFLLKVSGKGEEKTPINNLTLDKENIKTNLNSSPVELTAKVEPDNATYKNVKWVIENEKIATYDFVESDNTRKIKIKPKAVGSTKIKCTSQGTTSKKEHLTKEIDINISGDVHYVDNISINEKNAQNVIVLTEGDHKLLSCNFTPENSTDKRVKWHTSNQDIVSIDEGTGFVVAKTIGAAIITAKALGTSSQKPIVIDKCQAIVVVKKCEVTLTNNGFGSINKSKISVDIGTTFQEAIRKNDVIAAPKNCYALSHWVDENGKEIPSDFPITKNFQAKAIFVEVPKLSIKTPADLKTYVKGEYFDPIGLELEVAYQDGQTRVLNRNEWTTNIAYNSKLNNIGKQTVTVSLVNNPRSYVAYDINVIEKAEEIKCSDNHAYFGDIRVGFKLMSNQECVITEYDNRKGNLLIPDYVYRDGKKYYIKNIKRACFYDAKITGLDFHGIVDVDGTKVETQTRHLKVIEDKAFRDSNVLDHWIEHPQLILRFPEGLVEIREEVFTGTDLGQDKIGGYEFPSTIRKIGHSAIGDNVPWIEGNGGCLIFKCRKELVDIDQSAFWCLSGRHYTHRIIGKSPDGNEETSLEIAKSWATYLNDKCSNFFHTDNFKTLLVPSTKE